MSKLDEMIRELCPDGVEYVKLNSVCDIYDGTHSTPNYTESGVKFASVENIGNLYATRKYISEKDFEKYKIKPRIGDVMMTRIGSVGVCTVVDRNEALAFYVSLALLRPQLDKVQSRFLKYAIESIHGRKELRKRTLINAVPIKINKDDIGKVTIPLPPIEIQSEIVHTLDNYTENVVKLQNQLTAELTARQKQYEFYRDKLLTFDVLRGGTINFCQRTLGELFDFRNGLSKGKEFFGKGTLFIRYTDVYNHRTLRKKDITALVECTEDEKERLKVSRGDVLFTRTSETAEDIGWSSVMLDDMDDCVFNGFTIKATPKTKELLPEYCAYCFSTSDFRQYVTKHCAFTTRASLTGNTIAQYRMTIPPLDIQSRIVNVLDNFEKICSDLNIGLPAEIEARQKQYEYYRDKLLTFAENGNTILSRAEQSRAEQSRAEQSRAEQSRAEH